jgi:hypothetical protein
MDVLGYGMAGRTLAGVTPLLNNTTMIHVLQNTKEYARPSTFRFP